MGVRDDVYHFIMDFHEVKGYAPSYREIAGAVGIKSISTVRDHLNKLQSDGLISYVPHIPRSVHLIDSDYADD